jgi:hypothetical protein
VEGHRVKAIKDISRVGEHAFLNIVEQVKV